MARADPGGRDRRHEVQDGEGSGRHVGGDGSASGASDSGNRPTHRTIVTMDWITNPEAWIALLTLTVMEIVLGIDNVVFISVLVQRLPASSATVPGRSAWASRWGCGSCSC